MSLLFVAFVRVVLKVSTEDILCDDLEARDVCCDRRNIDEASDLRLPLAAAEASREAVAIVVTAPLGRNERLCCVIRAKDRAFGNFERRVRSRRENGGY